MTVLQRIEQLEKSNRDLNDKLASTFDRTRNQVAYVMEVVEAVTEVVNKEGPIEKFDTKVEASMTAKREVRKAERVAQENKQLADMVEMGVIKPANNITESSLIVGRSFDAQGEIQGIGREQFEFGNLHPEVKPKFLGQEVGFVFEANGSKMEVIEIYEITPQNEVKTTPVVNTNVPPPAPPQPAQDSAAAGS